MVRIGIMSFAHLHAHSYASVIPQITGCEFVGIADHDQKRAQDAATKYSVRAFESYDSLLASEIDAVIIASENINHRQLVEKAASAGKHILCEKPLGITVKDMEAMIEDCKSANVKLMTAFPCRFSPAYVRLKAAVESGKIGKVLAIKGTNRGRCPWDWFVDKAQSGGGAVIDHTVHVTDLLRDLLGCEPVEVYAEIGNGIYHREFDDSGFLTLSFQDGVFATIDTSWSRPNAFPTWGDVTLSVVGEAGVINMDMFAQNLVVYSDESNSVVWNNWGDNIDYLMVQAFANSISSHTDVPISGYDGMMAAKVALAAYRSYEVGEPSKV